jgi:hypothetical protein
MRVVKTARDFIDYFTAIPDDKWCIGDFTNDKGQHCAIGHLMAGSTANTSRLTQLFNEAFGDVVDTVCINDARSIDGDGDPRFKAFGKTPKERILMTLHAAEGLGL